MMNLYKAPDGFKETRQFFSTGYSNIPAIFCLDPIRFRGPPSGPTSVAALFYLSCISACDLRLTSQLGPVAIPEFLFRELLCRSSLVSVTTIAATRGENVGRKSGYPI